MLLFQHTKTTPAKQSVSGKSPDAITNTWKYNKVWEREKDKKRERVCLREREREKKRERVCLREREREKESVRERWPRRSSVTNYKSVVYYSITVIPYQPLTLIQLAFKSLHNNGKSAHCCVINISIDTAIQSLFIIRLCCVSGSYLSCQD